MPRLPLLALLVLLAATGCDSTPRACTLIGCTSALAVRLDAPGPVPDGAYTVTAAGGSEIEACTVTVDGARVETSSAQCSAYRFEGDLIVRLAPIEGRVTLSVARPSAAPAGAAVDLVYEPQFPNGPDCGAACVVADVTIPI